ncbi:hypothetical protein AA103196_2799 [Ameyamaea chiangmaiensis NBRC 103196]|nr:hypothetical protein AA103196_2799 [Ameyamaea chiangmaiensis NBRC 103196]
MERVLFVLVIADVGVALALLLLPPLVAGLLILLRDVFGALTLPFSVLFGMAGWNGDAAGLDRIVGGLAPALLRHPAQAMLGALTIVAGVVLSILGRRLPSRPAQFAAPCLDLVGGLLAGPPVIFILAPAIVIEIGLALCCPVRHRDPV